MSEACELYDSIDAVPPGVWEDARSATPSVFTEPAFLRAVEPGLPAGARLDHVLVSAGGRPAACASLCLLPVDLATVAGPSTQGSLSWVRRLLPGFGTIRVLICGLPVSAGQGPVAFADGADRERAVAALDDLVRAVARRQRARAIVYKEFGADDGTDLAERGYLRADSPPMYDFARPFADFADYCAALKSHYRADVRRSQRKFAAGGCRVVHHTDPREIRDLYTDEQHRLYEAVVAKSSVKLELLPAEFFRGLAEHLPGRVSLTAVYRDNRLVAFNWGLADGEALDFLYCGLDYARSGDTDLYFNLMYHQFDYAFRMGARVIHVGQTADAFKSRVGCTGHARHFFVRGVGPLLGWAVRRGRRLAFPGRGILPVHDVFKAEPAQPRARSARHGGTRSRS